MLRLLHSITHNQFLHRETWKKNFPLRVQDHFIDIIKHQREPIVRLQKATFNLLFPLRFAVVKDYKIFYIHFGLVRVAINTDFQFFHSLGYSTKNSFLSPKLKQQILMDYYSLAIRNGYTQSAALTTLTLCLAALQNQSTMRHLDIVSEYFMSAVAEHGVKLAKQATLIYLKVLKNCCDLSQAETEANLFLSVHSKSDK